MRRSRAVRQTGNQEPEPVPFVEQPIQQRHDGRQSPDRIAQDTVRFRVGPPTTVPMSSEEYARAVHAWAVLIAAWWVDNPPDDE